MFVIHLLILSTVIGLIVLSIHNRDEIHQLVAGLSGAIALVCVFILIPPLVKGILGLFFFAISQKALSLNQLHR